MLHHSASKTNPKVSWMDKSEFADEWEKETVSFGGIQKR